MKEVAEDLQYTDIYHGEVIRVNKKEEGAITANIPIDQEEVKISNSKIIRQNFWKNIKEDIGAVGPIFGVLSFLITPTILIGSFAVGHIILFLLFRRLARRQKPKSWGVVYDLDNRKPIKNAVARIFSPQHNRMLEAQVTDKYGRYGFLVDNNAYFIAASKEGYQDNKTAVVDLTHKKAQDIFGFDLWLKPETNGGLTVGRKRRASPIKQQDRFSRELIAWRISSPVKKNSDFSRLVGESEISQAQNSSRLNNLSVGSSPQSDRRLSADLNSSSVRNEVEETDVG